MLKPAFHTRLTSALALRSEVARFLEQVRAA